MQAALGGCKAVGRCRIGVWGGRGGCGSRMGVAGARAAHPASILSSLLGVEEHKEEGDVGPSSAGPQQKLGPGVSGPSSSQDLSSRLYLSPARETAGRPVWPKAPRRRSRKRRGQLFRTCARAACPDFWPLSLLRPRSAHPARPSWRRAPSICARDGVIPARTFEQRHRWTDSFLLSFCTCQILRVPIQVCHGTSYK